MDKVKIKRLKRQKKTVSTKEKILAGLGVGTTLLGGLGVVSAKQPKTQFARTQEKDSATGKIKKTLKNIFGLAFGGAKTVRAADTDQSGSVAAITTTSLPQGQVSRAYNATITVNCPIFSLGVSGLPPGLSFSTGYGQTTGVISGTATRAGSFTVTASVVSQTNGSTASKQFTLVIAPAGSVTINPSVTNVGDDDGRIEVNDTTTATGRVNPSVTHVTGSDTGDDNPVEVGDENSNVDENAGNSDAETEVADEAATGGGANTAANQNNQLISTLRQQISDLQSRINTLNAQIVSLGSGSSLVQSYQQQINNLQTQVLQLRATIKQLKQLRQSQTGASQVRVFERQTQGLQMPAGYEASQASQAASGQASAYTVKKGDTLWSISKKSYGDGKFWRKILEANTDQIKSPRALRVGISIAIPVLPDGGVQVQTRASSRPASAPAARTLQAPGAYTVRKGDTLWGISQKYYGTGLAWKNIQAANLDKVPNHYQMPVGISLQIPELSQAEIEQISASARVAVATNARQNSTVRTFEREQNLGTEQENQATGGPTGQTQNTYRSPYTRPSVTNVTSSDSGDTEDNEVEIRE